MLINFLNYIIKLKYWIFGLMLLQLFKATRILKLVMRLFVLFLQKIKKKLCAGFSYLIL